ncbi:MAG: hypothetical protein RIC55_18675 [Pirellulaceae bacterium]
MSRCAAALLFVLLVAAGVLAQEPDQPGEGKEPRRDADPRDADPRGADPRDSVERFVILAGSGPIVVEARLLVDGEPYYKQRDQLVDELLAAADGDGDGKVTLKEAGGDAKFLFGRNFPSGQQGISYLERLDRNRNEVIDRDEAALYVDQIGGPVFRLLSSSLSAYEPDLRELLDTNDDQALSKEELAVAAARLASRDANDDELVEAAEVMGVANGYGRGVQVLNRGGGARVANQVAHLLGPNANLVDLHETLKRRYGLEGEIVQSGLSLDDARFAKLDRNKNGYVEPGEAIGWHLVAPHLQLEVQMYSTPQSAPRVTIAHCNAALSRSETDADARTRVGVAGFGSELTFAADVTPPPQSYAASASAIMRQYDTDQNGYIEKKEIEDRPNARYFITQFETWDADGDGKVFAKEIEADYDRRIKPSRTRVGATAAERGVALFSALDTSGDGRLGIRERREAVERLGRYDKDGDGQITSHEMPSRVEINFAVGRDAYVSPVGRVVALGSPQNRPAPNAPTSDGLTWFVHMDTNGDGDVSRREFLGGKPAFDKLDKDRDGLLSRDEAKSAK